MLLELIELIALIALAIGGFRAWVEHSSQWGVLRSAQQKKWDRRQP